MSSRLFWGVLFALGAGSLGACGGSGSFTDPPEGAAGRGGASGVHLGSHESCPGLTQKAQRRPLDLYLMLDRSSSMSDKTATGVTKWDAVRKAVRSFLRNPKSASMSVGLQYFPLQTPGVPRTCQVEADCKGHGPCEPPLVRACTGSAGFDVPCNDDGDCGAVGGTCEAVGLCSLAPKKMCFAGGNAQQCGKGQGECQPLVRGVCEDEPQRTCMVQIEGSCDTPGACVPLDSTCKGHDSCDVADYARPAVAIAPVTKASSVIEASLSAHWPTSSTPTGPALAGAIEHAKAWAVGHPDHKVIAVLATDGLPTRCDPQGIEQVAAIAAQGAQERDPIVSFVIGVFGPNDVTEGALANLDQIAKQGGTDKAYLVSTSADVETQFLQALESIRGTVMACQFKIPQSPVALDYDKINVEVTVGGKRSKVPYVGGLAGCKLAGGGWYYDVDPKSGKKPTTIQTCPQTCEDFERDEASQVDIELGCDTVIPLIK